MIDGINPLEVAARLRRERPGLYDPEDAQALFHRALLDEEEAEEFRRRATADADEWYVGLDLGQLADFTALTVVRKSTALSGGRAETTADGERIHNLACVHLERWPLGTSYPQIVADVAGLMRRPEVPGAQLVVDATGVGRPVVDMFRAAGLGDVLTAVSITGGNTFSRAGGGINCAKVLLISAAQAALSGGRLKVAKGLPHAETLKKELLGYRVRVTGSANETFEARAGAHDDLVLALALPVWFCLYANSRWGAW